MRKLMYRYCTFTLLRLIVTICNNNCSNKCTSRAPKSPGFAGDIPNLDTSQTPILEYKTYKNATNLLAKHWVISYLKERTQRVVIGDQSLNTTSLATGVPRGSVLEPLLVSLYVQLIGDIIRSHGLFFHQYADDLQVYAHFDLTHFALVAAVKQMEDCLDEVKVWMARNSMIMNDGKIQYLPIVCRCNR